MKQKTNRRPCIFFISLVMIACLLAVTCIPALGASEDIGVGSAWRIGDTINLKEKWFVDHEDGTVQQSKDQDATVPKPTISGNKAKFESFLPVGSFYDKINNQVTPVPVDYATSQIEVSVPEGKQDSLIGIKIVKSNGTQESPYVFDALLDIPVTEVVLDQTTLSMVGTNMNEANENLVLTVSPENATDKTVVWSCSDDTILYASSNCNNWDLGYDNLCSLRPRGAGTATVTATATNGTKETDDDVSATCTVTIYAPYEIGTVWLSGETINLHGAWYLDAEGTAYVYHSKDENGLVPADPSVQPSGIVEFSNVIPVSEYTPLSKDDSTIYPYTDSTKGSLQLSCPADKKGKTPIGIKLVKGKGTGIEPYEFEPVYKSAPEVTAPEAKTLTYNGQVQELVKEGSVTGGTMAYALGQDAVMAPEDDWNESIPTGTDVGTYYVWYKAVGDADHDDSEPACVTSEIKEADNEDSEPQGPEETDPEEQGPGIPVDVIITVNVTFKVRNGSWNDGDWYYLYPLSGAMATGWVYDDENWYYMYPASGIMTTGWVLDGDTWFYLLSDGTMAVGEYLIDDTWYVFDDNGAWIA